MMMNVEKFGRLDANRQAEMLFTFGTVLEKMENGDFGYILFSLEDFYIEVTFRFKINQIVEIKAFKNSDHLDKYLEKITLDFC